MSQQQAEFIRIRLQLPRVFTPESPITHKDSFQGRTDEIRKVMDAVLRVGAHVAIFGERGVGKTSLAGLIDEFWRDLTKDTNILTGRVNCEPMDDYITIWAKIAEDITERMTVEQRSQNPQFDEYLTRMLQGEADPTLVRRAFQAYNGVIVIIVDEFDRLEDPETIQRMADTIKGLSDYSVNATLVIIGVADTIGQLIADHASVDRSLTQILLPRFDTDEIISVVKSRYNFIGLGYDEESLRLIAKLTHGLPYYAHLIGQSAGFAAVKDESAVIGISEVIGGLALATENTQESVKRTYYDAVASAHANSIHREVMLACALVHRDEFGYFRATDVREPLTRLLQEPVGVPRYLRYLSGFSDNTRGRVLHREGQPWKKRYWFADPLLETFVILKGIEDGLVDKALVMK